MIESDPATCQPLLRAKDPKGSRPEEEKEAPTERVPPLQRPRQIDRRKRVPPQGRKRPYSWVVFFRDFSIFAQVSLRVMVRLKTGMPDLSVSGSTQK